jgi:hypothetical protein
MKGTKFSRLLFRLVPKTHPIAEIDAGLLLKTPCSADAYTENLTKKEQRFGNSGTLAQEVQTGFIYQRGMLRTPTVMDAANNGDMTAAAKLMQGATHRSSGQPIQKSLTMEIHQQILAENQSLIQELANKQMLKRTNLPTQKEFVEWIRSVTNAKELSQMIDVKMSTAEHWFRTDGSGFSHPSIEEWTKIAEIFQVTEQMNARMMEQSSIDWVGLLPTPSASDIEGAPKRRDQISQGANGNWRRTSDNTGTKFGAKLNDIAPILAESTGKNSQLNPRFVAEMMGFPHNWTELPFLSGGKNRSKDTETQ